jgi:hypothetical protein
MVFLGVFVHIPQKCAMKVLNAIFHYFTFESNYITKAPPVLPAELLVPISNILIYGRTTSASQTMHSLNL